MSKTYEENKEEIESNRRAVILMFKGRCLMCNRRYEEIHEIEPKSHRPNDWWAIDNMCPLCSACHYWVTGAGTKITIPLLKKMRENRLKIMYEAEYRPVYTA